MQSRRAIRTIAILAFTAWTTLCCCERRVFAEWIGFALPQSGCCAADKSDLELPACCAAKHAGEDSESHAPSAEHQGCANKGCCDRLSGPMTSLDVPTDDVGIECVWQIDTNAMLIGEIASSDAVRPPPLQDEWIEVASFSPKLTLVISRRIRI